MHELFGKQTFSVSAITSLIKETLEGTFSDITIEGEISNFRPASSGHWYFQLNDVDSALQAVMFRQKSWRMSFLPKDGDRVRVTGNLSVYAKRGAYQIICETMSRLGEGDILALLEERKRQFAAAGYFDPQHKRPLPKHPKRLGVVTSSTGAAIRDILQVLKRRDPTLDVVIFPSAVQGTTAGRQIADHIRAANRWHVCDILIITRGGGSLEDLLPFSEQVVIEAIVDSQIPIVSAVGHEIDWALSDWAADVRAPTPSAAAELVSMDITELIAQVRGEKRRMAQSIEHRISLTRSHLKLYTPTRMHQYFSRRLEQAHMRADDTTDAIRATINERMYRALNSLTLVQKQLHALSPLAVLNRGYALVTHGLDHSIITQADQMELGERISIRFSQGRAVAITESIVKEQTNEF